MSLAASATDATASDPGVVAARVGDEPIYVGELLEGAASLALIGQQDVGERPGTREQLLERLIVARLLYLDGEARGLESDPRFRDDLAAAGDATLAARWLEDLRRRGCAKPATSCAEPAALRAAELARLRAATAVTIDEAALDPSLDATREPAAPVAHAGARAVSWRRVQSADGTLAAERSERVAAVGRAIDAMLLADAARAAGLDRDPGFQQLERNWRRAALVRVVREDVIAKDGLDAAGFEREYERHRDRFTLPAERQVQQIVVRTRPEAEEIVRLLAAPPEGTTFNTLARDRSIVPNAAATLGMVGWVRRDQGHPALSAAAFALAPGAVSDPIETDAGFHVIRVLAERAEEVAPLDDELRSRIRARWNANRIAEYAQHLAETTYPVTLFPETYASETLAAR
jgi:hypothetical protein